MRHHAIASVLVLLTVSCIRNASAQEANPAFWLLMPLAGQIAECSQQTPEIRQRLVASLETAKGTSRRLLPASAWGLLTAVVAPTPTYKTSPEKSKACEATIETFSSSAFPNRFRQMLATLFTVPLAIRCVVQQPTIAEQMRSAWRSAFIRNGFEVSEEAIDKAIASFKTDNSSPTSIDQCNDVLAFFAAEFDKQYSEETIYKMFEGKR